MDIAVSIAMAVFNGERHLPEQLKSILGQTRLPDEMVVADDHSSDGTLDIVRAFQAAAPFPVVVLPSEHNMGYARNFMRAADRCRGALIVFADQDDVWHPDKIAAVSAVDRAERPDVISHDLAISDERRPEACHESYYALLAARGFPPAVCCKGCSLSVRRDALLAWGWPPESSTVSHDVWIAVLATALGSRSFIRRPLITHRLHGGNASGWIACETDLVYTPATETGARSELEILVELCVKSWRMDWSEAFVDVADRLISADIAADQLSALKTVLVANRNFYELTPASDVRDPHAEDDHGRGSHGATAALALTPAGCVERLYRTVLRREVDPEGMAHFSHLIRETGDFTPVLLALLESEEYATLWHSAGRDVARGVEPAVLTPEDYVGRLYKIVLRREADLEGATHYSDLIRKTGDHTLVLHALMESEEYRNLHRPGQRDRLDLETGGAASIRFGEIGDLARSHPAAGLPVGLDILVPVHNAAEWLHTICDAYETFDARPLYVVDGASADDSLAILQRRGERVFTVHNPGQFVEPLLSRIIPYLAGQWILRIDDDELPTKGTFAWIGEHIGRVGEALIGLPRRWARSSHGSIESCTAADGSWNQDPQFRLFRPDSVRPISTLHTPGVEAETRLIATPEAGIIHLDWLVRGEVERKRKISRYEEHETNKGWIFKSLYLPEQMPPDYYQAEPIVDDVVLAACRRLLTTMGATGPDWPVLQR